MIRMTPHCRLLQCERKATTRRRSNEERRVKRAIRRKPAHGAHWVTCQWRKVNGRRSEVTGGNWQQRHSSFGGRQPDQPITPPPQLDRERRRRRRPSSHVHVIAISRPSPPSTTSTSPSRQSKLHQPLRHRAGRVAT